MRLFKRIANSEFWQKYGQLIINWIVFISIGRWIAVIGWEWYLAGELFQFVEFTFLIHMLLLLLLVVIRRPHKQIDSSLLRQAIALTAFFSGLAFHGPKTDNPSLITAARIVTSFSLVLGILVQINLGRSFGILIARRKIKTDFLYRLIRHPMYLTDMMFKVGILLKMPSWPNAGIMALGIGCYVYRAILEERFLSEDEEYRQYMRKVKYRFIPGIF